MALRTDRGDEGSRPSIRGDRPRVVPRRRERGRGIATEDGGARASRAGPVVTTDLDLALDQDGVPLGTDIAQNIASSATDVAFSIVRADAYALAAGRR